MMPSTRIYAIPWLENSIGVKGQYPMGKVEDCKVYEMGASYDQVCAVILFGAHISTTLHLEHTLHAQAQ